MRTLYEFMFLLIYSDIIWHHLYTSCMWIFAALGNEEDLPWTKMDAAPTWPLRMDLHSPPTSIMGPLLVFLCGNISTKNRSPKISPENGGFFERMQWDCLYIYIYIYRERERVLFGKVWCVFGRSNLGDTDANASFFGGELSWDTMRMRLACICIEAFASPNPVAKTWMWQKNSCMFFGWSKMIQKDPKSLWPEPRIFRSTILVKSCSKIWYNESVKSIRKDITRLQNLWKKSVKSINQWDSYLKIWYAPSFIALCLYWTFTEASCCFVSLGRGSGDSCQPLV